MLSTRSRFRVLSEIAENEQAEISIQDDGNQDKGQTGGDARREKRRKKIIKELFETEKTYLSHLEIVQKDFCFPLRFNCLIPEKVHNQLFSNIEQILVVNQKLLEFMEQTTVGEAFRYLGPFLKLYSTYANSHEQALATLQEWMQKSSEFSEFLCTQEEKPELKGLKLNALLITPVQRVPRYKLLLEDLLQHTPNEHHDYQQLKEASAQIGEIATHINEQIRQHENFQKMLSIQNSFDGSAPKILAPGRQFIKEGCLKKVSRRGGKPLERMFFLFSDMLIYGKPKFLDSGSHSYTCCCVLPLKHCQVEQVFGNVRKAESGGMFKVSCKDENLLLYTNEPDEVKEWIEVLQSEVRKLSDNRQTLRKPSSHKMPLRGKSIRKERKQEKKGDLQLKRRALNSVGEEDNSGCSSSSCLREGFSPLRLQLHALSDLDLSGCLSPSKRPKMHDDTTISPVVSSSLSTPSFGGQENMGFNNQEWATSTPGDLEIEENSPKTGGTEDTFMQMTMADLDTYDVSIDTFGKPPVVKDENQTNGGTVYYTRSAKRASGKSKRPACMRRPFQRLLEEGRGFSAGCRRLFNRAQARFQQRRSTTSTTTMTSNNNNTDKRRNSKKPFTRHTVH